MTKSAAPAFIPSTARLIEPQAVISTTGSAGVSALIRCSSARPSSPDVRREKFMSWITSWQGWRRSTSSASSGDAAVVDAKPACLSSRASDAVTAWSSSMIRIMGSGDRYS